MYENGGGKDRENTGSQSEIKIVIKLNKLPRSQHSVKSIHLLSYVLSLYDKLFMFV